MEIKLTLREPRSNTSSKSFQRAKIACKIVVIPLSTRSPFSKRTYYMQIRMGDEIDDGFTLKRRGVRSWRTDRRSGRAKPWPPRCALLF